MPHRIPSHKTSFCSECATLYIDKGAKLKLCPDCMKELTPLKDKAHKVNKVTEIWS